MVNSLNTAYLIILSLCGWTWSPDPNFCSKAQKMLYHWWSKARTLKISFLSFCGISDSGSGVSLPSYLLLGPFSFYLVASSSLDVRSRAWCYCILSYHVRLIARAACSFLEGGRGIMDLGRWGGPWGTERSGERGNSGQDGLYERRMKKRHLNSGSLSS